MVIDQWGTRKQPLLGYFNVGLLPSAMKCSGTCKVTFTVSGQDIWLPHTMAKTQELTAISVKAVLLTGLFNKPGKQIHRKITPSGENRGWCGSRKAYSSLV